MYSAINFPDPNATDSEKDTIEYGQKLAAAIFARHKGTSNVGWVTLQKRYNIARSYGQGTQSMSSIMNQLEIDGRESFVNIDFQPDAIGNKIKNVLVENLISQNEKVVCSTLDPWSATMKEKEKQDAQFRMQNMDKLQALAQQTGIPFHEPHKQTPASQQELDYYFDFGFKLDQEIFMEQGIDKVLTDSNWENIKAMLASDLVETDVIFTKVFYDQNKRLKIKRCKPENLVVTYSELQDCSDAWYIGEVVPYKIADARRKWPRVAEEKWHEWAKSCPNVFDNPSSMLDTGWNTNYNNSISRPYDDYTIPVYDLSVKLILGISFETGKDRYGKTAINENGAEKKIQLSNPETISRSYESRYDLCFVAGGDLSKAGVLTWSKAINQVRNPDSLEEVIHPYALYLPNNYHMTVKSIMEKMIPCIKAAEIAYANKQLLMANLPPDLIFYDLDAIEGVDLGQGAGALAPLEYVKLVKRTGAVFGRSRTESGDKKFGPPITQLAYNFESKLNAAITDYNFEIKRMNDMIGYNEFLEGTGYKPRMSGDVAQQAEQSSNNATQHLYRAYTSVLRQASKVVSRMLWDRIMFATNPKDEYILLFGIDRVKNLKENVGSNDIMFDMYLDTSMSKSDQQDLQQALNTALQEQTIDIDDIFKIKQLRNSKQAYLYLNHCIKEKAQEKQQQDQQNMQNTAQAQQQSAQVTSQLQQQLEQLKGQISMAKESQAQSAALQLATINNIGAIRIACITAGVPLPADIQAIVEKTFLQLESAEVQQAYQHLLQAEQEEQQQAQAQAQQQQAQAQQGGGQDPSQGQDQSQQGQDPNQGQDPSQEGQNPNQGQDPSQAQDPSQQGQPVQQ